MAKKFRFPVRSFNLVLTALAKGRSDLTVALLRAMHAELTLSAGAAEDGYERHLQHQRLAQQINERLNALGFEIVLGLFLRGASTEESLAEEFGKDVVVGYGPLAAMVERWLGRDYRSYEDGFGRSVQTFFFYEGDKTLEPGVYFRRLSQTGRHDYLVRVSPGPLAFVDPQILRENEEVKEVFEVALEADLREDDDEEPPTTPGPWQQLEEWLDDHPLVSRPWPAPEPLVRQSDADDLDLFYYEEDEDDDLPYLGESTLAKLRRGELRFPDEEDEENKGNE